VNQSTTSVGTFAELSGREWLETNGLGGWASSSVSGANTRRYHGLLVAATRPPLGRVVLLSKVDETIQLGSEQIELGCNIFPDALNPAGHERLTAFARDLFPVWRFSIGDAILEKTVVAIHGENTTVVEYRLIGGSAPVILGLRPFIAGRDHHGLLHEDGPGPVWRFGNGAFVTGPLAAGAQLFLSVRGADLVSMPQWWHRFEYPRERERGFDFHEDLWTPGVLRVPLAPGESVHLVASTNDPTGRDPAALIANERTRRTDLLGRLPHRDQVTVPLALAADQFLVRREDDQRTIIAGYHWFGDWGRDTLIALPGLTLATGRPELAREILATFARHFDQGMLPNRFPDSGDEPEYNSVDAALWFFVALHAYWRATGDDELVRELLPTMRRAVQWHRDGTRHGIRVDADGLLRAGEPGVQLTWMDAKVGDWVVTPRIGKPVEINALWVNALGILAEAECALGDADAADHFNTAMVRARRQFARVFWYEEGGYLHDVVDGDSRDSSLRPNQLLALSLPFPLLSAVRRRSILRVVEEALLTPAGLRTLAPSDPRYQPRYQGDVVARDGAYHQGTVWPWLLGPFVTALVRERGVRGRSQGRALIEQMMTQLTEAGVGSISEIFDAEPPHHPRGAIAQAWSVAELLRGWLLCITPEGSRH
jgi:predicted glycogen debranching enzyme